MAEEGVIYGKGVYFIGDICYALKDELYRKIWGKKHNYDDGTFSIGADKFSVAATADGDGCYLGSDGREYGVDAGVIGIVPMNLWENKTAKTVKRLSDCGRVVNVIDEMTFSACGGIFKITIDGDELVIDTKNEPDKEGQI